MNLKRAFELVEKLYSSSTCFNFVNGIGAYPITDESIFVFYLIFSRNIAQEKMCTFGFISDKGYRYDISDSTHFQDSIQGISTAYLSEERYITLFDKVYIFPDNMEVDVDVVYSYQNYYFDILLRNKKSGKYYTIYHGLIGTKSDTEFNGIVNMFLENKFISFSDNTFFRLINIGKKIGVDEETLFKYLDRYATKLNIDPNSLRLIFEIDS